MWWIVSDCPGRVAFCRSSFREGREPRDAIGCVQDSRDLVAGISPEVSSCADYADNTGHLTTMGRSTVGQAIGSYYAGQ